MRTQSYATRQNIEAKTRSWLAAVRASCAPRPRLELSLHKAALLVIDVNRYFAEPGGRAYLPATAAILPNIRSLIGAWRRRGGLVVYTAHAHEGAGDLGMLGRFFSDYIEAGQPEAELVSDLCPGPHEPVLTKKTYDAFLDTELEAILKGRGVQQVVITGVLTHMCCETTARSAFCRGFEVYVSADATASSCEERHVGSLLSMADCCAVIHSSAEILERCA